MDPQSRLRGEEKFCQFNHAQFCTRIISQTRKGIRNGWLKKNNNNNKKLERLQTYKNNTGAHWIFQTEIKTIWPRREGEHSLSTPGKDDEVQVQHTWVPHKWGI